MQDNSVPLGDPNINYSSALSDVPPSTPIKDRGEKVQLMLKGGVTLAHS